MVLRHNMDEDVWCISDTHWGHEPSITYDKRPFSSLEEMDAELIRRWNSVVKKNDTVYHVGDLSFYNFEKTKDIVDQLNGNIRLIRGNHDKKSFRNLVPWCDNMAHFRWGEHRFHVCHYPMDSWRYGTVMLHGHVHARTHRKMAYRVNVGCMHWDFTPVHVSRILTTMDRKEGLRMGAPQDD